MAEWFHCNKCFGRLTSSGGTKFLLTNCGHIFCEKCLQSGKQNICFVCRTECTTIALSPNMSPDIQIFFNDPEESLQKISKVVDFQKNHGKKLMQHILQENETLKNKYSHAKDYIQQLNDKYKTLQKDHQRLRNYLKMSINSPAPGNNSRRTPGINESMTPSSSAMVTPNLGNPNRFIVRGQPNGWNPNISRTSNNQNSTSFRTPSIYQQQTPSLLSVASGSQTSMGRPNGAPNGFSRPTPGSINLSGLTFGSRK